MLDNNTEIANSDDNSVDQKGRFIIATAIALFFGAVHLRAGIIGQKALFIMKRLGVEKKE